MVAMLSYFIPRSASNFAYRVLTPSMNVPYDWVTKAFQPQWAERAEVENLLVRELLGGPAKVFTSSPERMGADDYVIPGVIRQGGLLGSEDAPRISVIDRTIHGVTHKAYVISDRLGLEQEDHRFHIYHDRNVRVAIIGTVSEGSFKTSFLQVGRYVLPLTEDNISGALLYAEKLTAQIVSGTYDPAAARQDILREPQGLLRAWSEGVRDGLVGRMGRAVDRPSPRAG